MSGKGRSIGYYWIGTLSRPAAAFRRLLEDRRRFVKGFGAVLLGGVFYALAAAGLGAAGAVPMIPVVAGAPADNYYFWQILFTVPLVISCWILSTAVLRVLAGRRKGRAGATFKGMLALTGFALTAPFWLTWAFKCATAVLMFMGMSQEEWVEALSDPGFLQTLFFGVQAVALAWSWILVSLSAALSRKVGGLRAVLAGLAAEAVFILPMIVFIR